MPTTDRDHAALMAFLNEGCPCHAHRVCSWCHAPAAIVGSPAAMPGERVCRPSGAYAASSGDRCAQPNARGQWMWVFDGGPSGHGVWWDFTHNGVTVTDGSRSRPTAGPMAGIGPFMCVDCHAGSV